MGNRNLNRSMFALLVSLAAIRGFNFTAIKVSLSGLTPLMSSGWRNGIAGCTLIGYALVFRRPLWPPRELRNRLLGMGALFALNFLIVYSAMSHTTASRSSILMNSQPLAVALLSRFFIPTDRVTRQKLIGLLLAFLGVILVLGDKESSFLFATLRGDLLMLLAAFIWGIMVILRKKISQQVDPGVVAAWEVMVSALTLISMGWILDGPESIHLSTPVVLALLYSSLIGGALIFGVNVYLIKHYDVNAVSSFNFVTPVVGTVAGILILNEPFSLQILMGMVLVAAGIYVVNHMPRSGGKSYGTFEVRVARKKGIA